MSLLNEEELMALIKNAVRDVLREELPKPTASQDGYLSVSEAARTAGVTPQTIRGWMDEGRLQRFHAGRHLRVRRSDLERLMATAQASPAARETTPEEKALEIFMKRRDFGRDPE